MKSHLEHLATVFQTLENHQLYAKQSKYRFACSEIDYLDHLILKLGVRADSKKLDSMVNWPDPKTIKSLRGVLGLKKNTIESSLTIMVRRLPL